MKSQAAENATPEGSGQQPDKIGQLVICVPPTMVEYKMEIAGSQQVRW